MEPYNAGPGRVSAGASPMLGAASHGFVFSNNSPC
jgi:hypothetical protein